MKKDDFLLHSVPLSWVSFAFIYMYIACVPIPSLKTRPRLKIPILGSSRKQSASYTHSPRKVSSSQTGCVSPQGSTADLTEEQRTNPSRREPPATLCDSETASNLGQKFLLLNLLLFSWSWLEMSTMSCTEYQEMGWWSHRAKARTCQISRKDLNIQSDAWTKRASTLHIS